MTEPKPSKIPRPSAPTRPLPATGYVSEAITTHRSMPHTPTPTPRTPTPHSTSDKRQLKVVIHGVPQSNDSEETTPKSTTRTSRGLKSMNITTYEEKLKLPKHHVKKLPINGNELKKTATKGKGVEDNRRKKKRKPKIIRNW